MDSTGEDEQVTVTFKRDVKGTSNVRLGGTISVVDDTGVGRCKFFSKIV